MPQGCSGEPAAILIPDCGEGLAQVLIARQASRNIAAGNEEVDFLQQRFYTGVEVVQVGDHWDSGVAGPSCCDRRGGGIVAIDVKGAGMSDPLPLEFFRS